MSDRACRGAQDLQALHRRGLPALGVGPVATRCHGADGALLAHAAQASRKDVRDAVVAARKAVRRAGSGATAYNRGPGALPRGRDARGPARAVRRRGRGSRGPRPPAAPRAGRRGDRPLGLVRRLGRQVRAGRRRDQPGRRAVLQLLAARADRRGRRSLAPQDSSLLGLVSVLAPGARPPATRRSSSRPRSARCPRSRSAEVLATSDLPGRRGQPADRLHRRARALAGRATATSTPLDLTGVGGRRARRAADRRGRQRQARLRPARPTTGPPIPGIARLSAFVETKTVWHPIGV